MKKILLYLIGIYLAVGLTVCANGLLNWHKQRKKTKELEERFIRMKKGMVDELAYLKIREFGDVLNENNERLMEQIQKTTNEYADFYKRFHKSEELKKCKSYDEWDKLFQENVDVVCTMLIFMETNGMIENPWYKVDSEIRAFMLDREYRLRYGVGLA